MNIDTNSEDRESNIQETFYLLSIPDMKRSIQEGIKTPLSECSLLAEECEKLDVKFEQGMAEIGMNEDLELWPKS